MFHVEHFEFEICDLKAISYDKTQEAFPVFSF